LALTFKAFKLASLYSSHAAEELASIEFISRRVFDVGGGLGLREYLAETASGKQFVSLNSWQSALYVCLSKSDWFCEIRFQS
jgi:hypothetical protein